HRRPIALSWRPTHSTVKGPSRELTSDPRTVSASAASERTTRTFRDTTRPSRPSPYNRNGTPNRPLVCTLTHIGDLHIGPQVGGPPNGPPLGCRSSWGIGGMSPQTQQTGEFVSAPSRSAAKNRLLDRKSTRLN